MMQKDDENSPRPCETSPQNPLRKALKRMLFPDLLLVRGIGSNVHTVWRQLIASKN